jgi:hypothetical protein
MTAPAYVDFANDKLRVHQELDRHRQLVHTKGANPARAFGIGATPAQSL